MSKLFFILMVNVISYTNAGILNNGNGVDASDRLNRDGLTSTLIKTQQLNDDSRLRSNMIDSGVDSSLQSLNDPLSNENDRKNDNSHFALYYKSNSPGRLVTSELEHRFRKNPNFYSPNAYYMKVNSLQNFDANPDSSLKYVSNNVPYQSSNNARNNLKNRQTMLNIHYHDNLDNGNLVE